MAFRPKKKQPQFADLKGILAQTKEKTESALYQTVQEIIDRLTQLQLILNEEIKGKSSDADAIKKFASRFATYHTKEDETSQLPNSWQLLAGTGISFNDSIPNKRTISSTGSGSGGYAPVSTGAEPLEIMSDGAGSVLMVGFNE